MENTIKNEVSTEQFCGIPLYNWKNWDELDTDNFYFYSVEFLIPSMTKYNGMDVSRYFDGRMVIFSRDNATEVVWSGFVTDIPEVMSELIKRSKKN